MNLTFNLELDFKANKNGEKLLMLRVTEKGQHRRLNTGIRIAPKYWDNERKKVKKNHPQSQKLNQSLIKKLEDTEETYLTLMNEKSLDSLEEFIAEISKPKSINFFQFAKDYKLNQFISKNKQGTYRRYEAVLNKLKEYAGKGLTIKQVNYTLIKDFETHLLEVKKNGRDTVSSNLSVIRTILNEAVKHGLYDKRNPFDSVSLKYTSNSKLKLTIEELSAFSKVVLPNIHSLHLARDFFMACFYAAGCRGGDMVAMKWDNLQGENFSYTQQKTGKHLTLPILPELAKIFERYRNNLVFIFPLVKQGDELTERIINSRLTYINKYLKEVCKYAGIFKKITTHCARHTFSDISLSLNQNDIFGLKDVLGHSSVKTTEGYLNNRNYSKAGEYLKSVQQLLDRNKEG